MTSKTKAYLFIVESIFLFAVIFAAAITGDFIIQKPILSNLFRLMISAFSDSGMKIYAWGSVFGGIAGSMLTLYLMSGLNTENKKRYIRGARIIVDGSVLAQMTKGKKGSQIYLAGVPIPKSVEGLHLLIVGSTGTGKTVSVDEMISCCAKRGDRLIIVDPNGHALERFGQPDDVVLNPFDARCPGWSIFNEFREPYDYDRFAKSIIPDATNSSDQAWHGFAQLLLSQTSKALVTEGQMSTQQLLYWLLAAPMKDLAGLLIGSPASGLFEPGAEKALASTRFVLTTFLSSFQYLKPGDFSIRKWHEAKSGNLFITWSQDSHTTLRPLISCWIDIMTTVILSSEPDNNRRIWLFLDELASLERLGALEDGLTKGRKFGLRIVAGLQAIAQLDSIYGKDKATVLRSCFRNILVLGGSSTDPHTAEEVSKGLGKWEFEKLHVNYSHGSHGSTVSQNTQSDKEDAILQSEITSLPELQGFLKFAGAYPIGRIHLRYYNRPFCVPAYIKR